MSVLDYGDVIYMHASMHCQHMLHIVYHGELKLIGNFRALTHHCSSYARVGWSAFSTWRISHWHILIYKAASILSTDLHNTKYGKLLSLLSGLILANYP